jgi:hypothetical protein
MDTIENCMIETDTAHGEKLRVTCIERRYKITGSKSSFIIVAKKEFDENTTEKMLHEDMELKTFLANYEIVNASSISSEEENINIHKRKIPEIGKSEIEKPEEENINIHKRKIPEIEKPEIGKSEIGKSEIGKSEIGKSEIENKEESEATKKRREIIMSTLKRREMFDSLDLPEEFLVRDYIDVIEKNGIKISNSAMPYDDLKWLTKMGKVKMIKKSERGITTYAKIKKVVTENEMELQQEKNQSDDYYGKDLLPDKQSIDIYIS